MAEGIELATAYVQIVPSAEGIKGKISAALGDEADVAGKEAGGKAGKSLVDSLKKGILGGAAALGAATTALVSGLINGAKETANYGDEIDKMSQKIGISAEAYQKWDYVMERAGADVNNLKVGMKTLNAAALSGSEAFTKLGISQEALASMSQEELLQATIEGLAGMEEGAERSALAVELLGKAGMDLAPLLNEGTEEIHAQMLMAEEYGMVLSDDAVTASAVFCDSLTTLQNTIGGLKNSMMTEFMPSMSSVMDGLAMVFAGNEEGMELVEEGIDGFIDKIGEILPAVIDVGSKILVTLAETIIEHLPDLIESAVGIITQLVTTIIDHLPEIIESAIKIVMALVKGIIQAIPQIVKAMWDLLTRLIGTVIENFPKIMQKGKEILTNLATGIGQGIFSVLSKVRETIGKIIQKFKDSVRDFIEAGKNMLLGIGQGISNAVGSVVEGAVNAAKNILGKVKGFFGIHSPSSLFRDQIGKNLMLGFAEGIEENENKVSGAIDDVNKTVASGLDTDWAVDATINPGMYAPASADTTTNYGGIVINVYGDDKDPRAIAEEVNNILMSQIQRGKAVFG